MRLSFHAEGYSILLVLFLDLIVLRKLIYTHTHKFLLYGCFCNCYTKSSNCFVITYKSTLKALIVSASLALLNEATSVEF